VNPRLRLQHHKCVEWSPYGLLLDFTTALERIRVLGVPLGISSFTSSFIKYVMLKNIRHVDLFLTMGDVHITLVFHNTNKDYLYVSVTSFVP
jgi:hypothetical protein